VSVVCPKWPGCSKGHLNRHEAGQAHGVRRDLVVNDVYESDLFQPNPMSTFCLHGSWLKLDFKWIAWSSEDVRYSYLEIFTSNEPSVQIDVQQAINSTYKSIDKILLDARKQNGDDGGLPDQDLSINIGGTRVLGEAQSCQRKAGQ
jgi:hypothetical protein